jgi:tetratricopeptide (TPR) repeat protein
MARVVCVLFSVLCLCPSAARADILCLKDGRIINGPAMNRNEGGIEVIFKNGTVFVPSALVMEAIIEGASTFVPETDLEKKQVAKGLVPFQGRWMSPAKRGKEIDRYIARRRAAIADEEAHRLWRNRRKEKTKHFEFEYSVPQHIFERFRDLMEAYFTTFAKDWNVRQPKLLGRLKVCFYIDRETFAQIGGAGGGTAGYFRFVEPMELNFYYDRLDTSFTEEVMFHETNHYLTKLLNVDFNYPHFPGESLAEYYGASTYDPKKKKIITGRIQEGRLTGIKTDIAAGKLMTLEKLVTTERMYEHYNWGWSLVHFLMNDSRYTKKFQKFAISLAKDKKVKRTTSRGLTTVRGDEIFRTFKRFLGLKKKEDVARLENAWHNYVAEKLKLVTPRGKVKAAVAAMGGYPSRPIRAKRLFEEAIAEGSENPIAFHKYAELLSNDDRHDEAIAMWKRAISFDPLNPQFYARLGRALAKKGDKEEGTRLMKLAIEIDPDYAWTIEAQLQRLLEEDEEEAE